MDAARSHTWKEAADVIAATAVNSRISRFFIELGNYQHLPSEELEALASRLHGARVIYGDELHEGRNRPYWWRLPGRTTLLVVAPEWDTSHVFISPWLTSEERDEASERVRAWVQAARLLDHVDAPRDLLRADFGDDWDAPWLARFRQILAFPSLETTEDEARAEFTRILEESAQSGDSRLVLIALARRHQPLPSHGLLASIREKAAEDGHTYSLDEKSWEGLTHEGDDQGLVVFP